MGICNVMSCFLFEVVVHGFVYVLVRLALEQLSSDDLIDHDVAAAILS